jgi:hypothetical protein
MNAKEIKLALKGKLNKNKSIAGAELDTLVDLLYDVAAAETLALAVTDETTALTAPDNGKVTFQMPYAFKLTEVRATLTTAGTTSGATTIDINNGGTSILSTKLTVDFGEKTSTSAAAKAIISSPELKEGDEITIDIDAVSGGATEAGLKVYLLGIKL